MMQAQPPMLRASLSAASNYGRLQAGAEDHFIQQNAWANPQHPVHQMHRQVSALSQADTPSATPASQKHALQLQGSASTVAEVQSEPSLSVIPSPATLNRPAQGRIDIDNAFLHTSEETPSRNPGQLDPRKDPSGKIQQKGGHAPGSNRSERFASSKPSPITKFPVVKAEDSSLHHQHHASPANDLVTSSAIGADSHLHRSRIST